MDEYIKREAAIHAIMKVYVRTAGYKARERVFEAKDAVHRLPAADVAPVVRCKECKHRYSDSWCEYVDDDDNFYCARGERKEGAN